MKRPKQNEWMDSNLPSNSKEGQEEEEEEEDEGVRRVRVGFKAKRERRQGNSGATMCQVCNIRLNSSAQAQIHYRGKTHQRRLRRLAKAVSAGWKIQIFLPNTRENWFWLYFRNVSCLLVYVGPTGHFVPIISRYTLTLRSFNTCFLQFMIQSNPPVFMRCFKKPAQDQRGKRADHVTMWELLQQKCTL